MKRRAIALLIFLTLLVTGCSKDMAVSQALPTVTASPKRTLDPTPTRSALRPVTTPTQTALPPASPTVAATSSPAPAPMATDSLPAPTLFEQAWEDRSLFRAGLVPAAQAVLEQLPSASFYMMDLVIAGEMTRVSGRQEIRYVNQETVPLDVLYFHLYPNLLGGSITVSDVAVNGREAVPVLENGSAVMRVPLAESLAPGAAIIVSLSFETTVPDAGGRNYGIFAYQEEILTLAHFYPVIAVFDDAGWDIDLPSGQGDVTYADTSFFLVRVTAPQQQVLAASGVDLSGAGMTPVYAAGPMRDFYLVASANYVAQTRVIEGVVVNSYAPVGYEQGATAVLDFAANALASFNPRFGPYPFTELDIVATPTQALGVEYPGIVANALRIYLSPSSSLTPDFTRLESTTAHEIGHQWFYSLVGNDQLEEPWLDESLTQYATYLYYLDTYGTDAAAEAYTWLAGYWDAAGQADIPVGLPVAAYEGAEYVAIVYGRGPLFVHELEQTMGEERFAAFLRDYVDHFRWLIATGSDFQQLAEQYCQCELDALFAEWVWGSS